MPVVKFVKITLFGIVCLALTACSSHAADKSPSPKMMVGKASADSIDVQKIYTEAIAEFIKVVYKNDGISFDTLFFGKHVYGQPDDFPDITLPETIEGVPVRLIAPDLGLKMQQARNSLVYINLMGWVDKAAADFIFVVFSNGGAHQYDYFIDFAFNPTQSDFALEQIQLERYLPGQTEKPKRVVIFKDGQYSPEKQ